MLIKGPKGFVISRYKAFLFVFIALDPETFFSLVHNPERDHLFYGVYRTSESGFPYFGSL